MRLLDGAAGVSSPAPPLAILSPCPRSTETYDPQGLAAVHMLG